MGVVVLVYGETWCSSEGGKVKEVGGGDGAAAAEWSGRKDCVSPLLLPLSSRDS